VNNLLDDRDDDHHARPGSDREITLGTTMILLIFFALAVYGAALFGFGYSLGSKHTSASNGTVAGASTSSASFSSFKPAPGSPVGAASAEKPPTQTATPAVPYMPPPTAVKVDLPAPKTAVETAESDDVALRSRTPSPAPAAPAAAASSTAPAPVPVPGFGTVVVQVAAVSHEEDADLIASTLKRRGYVVNIRTEADKLLHVQVGPFATRKDAEAMKAKLLSDGFNAYIK
jgi:cell division septation protein DedD